MKLKINFCRISYVITLLLFSICINARAAVAPSNLVASAISANQIKLTWTDADNEDYYIVQRSSDGGSTWPVSKTVAKNSVSFISGGLRSTSTYHYRICGVTAGVQTAYSNTASATTGAIPAATFYSQKVSNIALSTIYKLSNPNVSSIISNANSVLYGYTDEEWLALVPVQGGRDNVTSPITGSGTWTWSSRSPNRITDSGGNVFEYSSPTKTKQVKVLSGKTVAAPLWDGPQGTNKLVGGQINWEKLNFLHNNLDKLAQAYEVTGDEKYAYRVAITLDSLAKCVPHYFITNKNGDQVWTPEQALASGEDFQRCSDHNGVAHEINDDIILPYDRIKTCDTMAILSQRAGYSMKDSIEKNFYKNVVYYLKDFFPYTWHLRTNIPFHVANAQKVANILKLSDYTEWNYHFVDSAISLNIMRDGVCPESFSYGMNYLKNNIAAVTELKKYCDIYANQPEIQSFKADVLRINNFYNWALQQPVKVSYPDGYLPPLDNTSYDKYTARTVTKTDALPSYGHVMLGDGSNANQVQWNQHFAGGANHMDATGNSTVMYAFGTEITGAIRYYRYAGRNWAQSTLSHNTVVVNFKDQETDYENAVDNANEYFLIGNLSLLEANNNGISIAESDARARYINSSDPVTRYQRLSALNNIDPAHPYVLDLFKVVGGKVHDYVMHGSTSYDQTAVASIPMTKMAGDRPLLNPGSVWKEPTDMGSDNDWYGIFRNVYAAKSPGHWDVTMKKTDNTKGLRLFMADNKKPRILMGESPAPTRLAETSPNLYKYYRPGVIVRNTDSTTNKLETLFAGIIEPLNGTSYIDSVRKIPLKTENPEHIALAVFLKNGRKDVWLVNMNNPKLTDITASPELLTHDSAFSLKGRIGFFSNQSKNLLVAGTSMRYKNTTITKDTDGYRGTITGITRIATGSTTDAFITTTDLPAGDVLKDKWIALYYGVYNNVPSSGGTYKYNVREQKGMNQMYKIKNIEKKDGKTYINLYDDHFLKMVNGNFQEIMRPHRKFSGPNDFIIYTSQFDATPLTITFSNVHTGNSQSKAQPDVQIWSEDNKILINFADKQPGKNAYVTVYNLQGSEIARKQLTARQTRIGMGQFSGVLIVQVVDGSNILNKKIFIK